MTLAFDELPSSLLAHIAGFACVSIREIVTCRRVSKNTYRELNGKVLELLFARLIRETYKFESKAGFDTWTDMAKQMANFKCVGTWRVDAFEKSGIRVRYEIQVSNCYPGYPQL